MLHLPKKNLVKAYSLILDTNLSVDYYRKLKNMTDSHGAPVFLCYDYGVWSEGKRQLMPKSVVDEVSTLTSSIPDIAHAGGCRKQAG